MTATGYGVVDVARASRSSWRSSRLLGRADAGVFAHADPRNRIKPHPRFVRSYRPKAGLQHVFGDHDKPEMLVQRAVPRDVDEGCESERRISRFDGPRVYRFEQILTESPSLVVRKDADLLNVSVSVNDIHNDVANRSIAVVDGNPTASAARVVFQHLDRHGIRVGYPVHSERPELFSREPFDLSERRGLC